jgi:tol-pal system protein YbgF
MIHLLLLLACVIDRTGRSGPTAMSNELAEHDRRIRELEVVSEDMARRVGQLEEVTRARGQEEILKMETMEQLRSEVARVRGDLEVLQRDYGLFAEAGSGFQQDADARLLNTEARLAAVEKSLGIKPPAATGAPAAAAVVPAASSDTAASTTAEAAPVASSPEDAFALIEKNLSEGNGGAARAVAKRFIADHPKHDRVAEAYYRLAESWQNEGDYKQAAAAFQVVVDKYPQATWASWSMLRQGECFDSLGDKESARIFYGDVVKVYPKSKAAKEAKTHLGK